MKKRDSLYWSNKAHKRLEMKHRNLMKVGKGSFEAHQQKALYHGAVVLRQKSAGKVFNLLERKKVFDDVVKTFY